MDLPTLSVKLHQPDGGNIKVAVTELPLFMKAVKEVPIRSLHAVPVETLQVQYGKFLEKLETLTARMKMDDIQNTNPKDFIMKFFKTTDKLFVGIEMIMQAIAVCCVKQSCESILEFMVSTDENHFDSNRNMGEESVKEEFPLQ